MSLGFRLARWSASATRIGSKRIAMVTTANRPLQTLASRFDTNGKLMPSESKWNWVQFRGMASDETGKTSGRRELDMETYNQLSDDLLHALEEQIMTPEIENNFDLDEFEVEYSQGVLTIKLGKYGVWVLNKQAPNQEIWWSSPMSGPKRFYYDVEAKEWLNTRDQTSLQNLLKKEIGDVIEGNLHIKSK